MLQIFVVLFIKCRLRHSKILIINDIQPFHTRHLQQDGVRPKVRAAGPWSIKAPEVPDCISLISCLWWVSAMQIFLSSTSQS